MDMEAGNSNGGLKKKHKIRTHGIVSEGKDRLSDLPDNILHYILSSFNTNNLVRTSILSRRWRCLWKDVPALNFNGHFYNKKSDFIYHISKFLSLRSDSAVSSIAFDIGSKWSNLDINLFDTVMKYAASHGTGEHGLRELSIRFAFRNFDFSSRAASFMTDHHYESVKTLKFDGYNLQSTGVLGLGFDFLTTLELRHCYLCSSSASGKSVDPFADLPRLNYLKLVQCTTLECCLKVSGLELLDLEIHEPIYGSKLEIFAPKLKSFVFRGHITVLAKVSLPSLDCANIRIWWVMECVRDYSWVEEVKQAYMKLLPGLHNVTSLNLRFDKFGDRRPWEQPEFPLNRMRSMMESEASPFTRLRNLTVQYPQEPPCTPYQVIRYFLEGSPNTEEKYVHFQKRIK